MRKCLLPSRKTVLIPVSSHGALDRSLQFDSRLSTLTKVPRALGWGMYGISGHLCTEPPCLYTSVAPITVAAERRYCLIRLILGVGGKERDRCLSLVAVGAVPA